MLDNPSMDSAATTANIATIRRYAPPNQRNRSLGRRKSGGERLERANSYSNDGEKNPIGTYRSIPMTDHGDTGGNNRTNENPRFKLIPLHGCCNSEALQLLNDRWTAAMSALNNLPEDSAAPAEEIEGIWPPKGIGVLDPWEIPFFNTFIPLSSGAAVTWAHRAILAGKEKRAVYALVATVLLAFKEWNIIKHPPLFQIVFMVRPFS